MSKGTQFAQLRAVPHTLHDRDVNKHMNEFATSGDALFRAMYGDTADSVQGLLDSAYPDLGKMHPDLPPPCPISYKHRDHQDGGATSLDTE